MIIRTHPDFPGFRPYFSQMKAKAAKLARLETFELYDLLQPLTGVDLLREAESLPGRRDRWLPVVVVLLAFLLQTLNPGTSCREAQRSIQAWWLRRGRCWTQSGTEAYCMARKALPLWLLVKVWKQLATKLGQLGAVARLQGARREVLIDGTTLSMPDTEANQEAWPQMANQKPGCGFPLTRVLGVFCLQTGAILHAINGPFKCAEHRLFALIRRHLQTGDIAVLDRLFCSFATFALAIRRHVDVVIRAKYAGKINWKVGKRLGQNDRVIEMPRPSYGKPVTVGHYFWNRIPKTIKVRITAVRVKRKGFRVQKLTLMTTLLDPIEWPPQRLAELYLRRWRVELFFDDIKTSMGAAVLRTKSPDMIYRELVMFAIAYNLIRCLMWRAALQGEIPVERMSFKGTQDTLRQFTPNLFTNPSKKKAEALLEFLIELCSLDRVPERPGRREPRAIKRRPKPYPLLTSKRNVMREARKKGPSTKMEAPQGGW